MKCTTPMEDNLAHLPKFGCWNGEQSSLCTDVERAPGHTVQFKKQTNKYQTMVKDSVYGILRFTYVEIKTYVCI